MLARYRPAPGALFATLTDGAVVLDIQTKKSFSLNETGATLWMCIQDGLDANAMIEALLRRYEVREEDARDAVVSLLQSLAAEQLIEPVEM